VKRVALPTGVALAVQDEGAGDPILFLHGFPESHRTWRHQIVDLSADHRVIAPDQRGFGASDKPEGISAYETAKPVADLIALADALGIHRFTLVGHDWGGAVAWSAALACPDRVARLVVVNAPHPFIFQRSLIEDEAQRAASQYIRAFRIPGLEDSIRAMGLETFFEKSFGPHVDLASIPAEERAAYLADWAQPGALTAMLNWYRASRIEVPAAADHVLVPEWARGPVPRLSMPVLVIWGMKDKALLPVQLKGLHAVIDNLRVVTVPDAGHFVPWERPETVNSAIRDFLADSGGAG